MLCHHNPPSRSPRLFIHHCAGSHWIWPDGGFGAIVERILGISHRPVVAGTCLVSVILPERYVTIGRLASRKHAGGRKPMRSVSGSQNTYSETLDCKEAVQLGLRVENKESPDGFLKYYSRQILGVTPWGDRPLSRASCCLPPRLKKKPYFSSLSSSLSGSIYVTISASS